MQLIIIGIIIVTIIVLSVVTYWWFHKPEAPVVVPPAAQPATSVAVDPNVKTYATLPGITFTNVSAASAETATTPAMAGTTIIQAPGGTLTQYGDETPVSAEEDEHFQPYMSILTNDVFRSDASFDPPLSKPEHEIYGNYD
jgi:hypothetical protein